MRPGIHLLCALVVALSGIASAVFVVAANGWMNTPAGIRMEQGRIAEVDPFAAMLNPSAIDEAIHMVLAAFIATGFLVAGIHAMRLLKAPHRPFDERAIDIPKMLSVLVHRDANAVVEGLDRVPRDQWPPVPVVHVAFQVMVDSGLILMGLALWAGWRWMRWPKPLASRPFLWALALASPLGFVAIECGWVVTEVGRQPWIIAGVMRTADAVTPMPGLVVPFAIFTGLYLVLGLIMVWLMAHLVIASPYSETEGQPRRQHAVA